MNTEKYCGACDGWLSFIKPPHHKFFNAECMVHDTMYDIGGNRQDRLNADVLLFNQMVRKAVGYFENRSVSSLWWFISLAYLYYLAVRVFGKSRFNYKIKSVK